MSEYDVYGMPRGWRKEEVRMEEQVADAARLARAALEADLTNARQAGTSSQKTVEPEAVASLAAGILVARALQSSGGDKESA